MNERPDTECASCRRAEQTWWQNLGDRLAETFTRPAPDFGATTRNMISAFTGATDWWAVDPEKMHRRLYEKTGNPLELERLLRHVEIPR